MEDVRLGRRTQTNQRNIALADVTSLLVPYDPSRAALLISSHAVEPLYLHFDGPAVAGADLLLPPNTPPLQLDIQTDGAMARGPWQAVLNATKTATVGVVETLLTEQ